MYSQKCVFTDKNMFVVPPFIVDIQHLCIGCQALSTTISIESLIHFYMHTMLSCRQIMPKDLIEIVHWIQIMAKRFIKHSNLLLKIAIKAKNTFLPWTNKSMIASGLWRSLTRQIYSAVSLANAGWNCKLKFSGDNVIWNDSKW